MLSKVFLLLALAARASAFASLPKAREEAGIADGGTGGWDMESSSWTNEGSAGGSATFRGTAPLTEVLVKGHGAEAGVAALRGTTKSIIDFGAVIPSVFTICSATRCLPGYQ